MLWAVIIFPSAKRNEEATKKATNNKDAIRIFLLINLFLQTHLRNR